MTTISSTEITIFVMTPESIRDQDTKSEATVLPAKEPDQVPCSEPHVVERPAEP